MRIRCQRGKFVPLFSVIERFTSTRDVQQVIQNVKIVANESGVTLMATDREVSARGELPQDDSIIVERAGETILPAKLLKKVFAESTADEFLIELKDSGLTIEGRNANYRLDMISEPETFPAVASFQATSFYKIPVNSFNRLVGRTVFATETNNSHYELRGVKFFFSKDRVTAVATDGRRLAYQECSAEAVAEDQNAKEVEDKEAIFPTRALNLVKNADADADEILIAVRDTEAQIKFGNIVVSTTLMTGRFPDWNTIVPEKAQKKRVDFIADELARSIRQAEIVATENKPGVWFKFEKGKVNITAAGDATGQSNVELPLTYDSEPSEFRLDSRFLNEFLREIPAEETVALYFSENDYRTLFETSDGYRYVVMQLV
ncbi:MAG: DNA polymerase III subunit beta [Thermoguttaceae bacterium]